jgi:hypothetical protein
MAKQDVEQHKVKISIIPPPESTLKHVDDVFIVITEAYCPNGHNLITDDNEKFDEYPGIKLKIISKDKSGYLYISPFHGDASKKGDCNWNSGEKLEIRCPVCDVVLPTMARCHCTTDNNQNGDLIKLHTSRALSDSHVLAFCNVWGCRRSRTIDNWNIISEYLDGQISDK